MAPAELSTGMLGSRVDMWRHCAGLSCACPGRLEMSRGSVQAKHVMLQGHQSSVDHPNSCQLMPECLTTHNWSCITSPTALRTGHVTSRGGKAVLVISQFSHNLPVSLKQQNTAKNLKLTQVEHACSLIDWCWSVSLMTDW